jgi:hypothetical protein
VFIGPRRRVAAVTIALGGLAAGAAAGCAGDSHKTAKTSTATAVVPVSKEVQQDVAKVWPEAARIWPGVVLKDRRIILGDGRTTRLITVEGVTALDAATLAAKKVAVPATGSLYTKWDGHPAVVINSADPAYAEDAKADGVSLSTVLFGAATDELFHSWQQRGRPPHDRELRGTEYPLAVTPRLYRAMLYNEVLAAYREPGQRTRHLATAAYWYGRWTKEFPDEARRAAPTDANEGAAGYFDAVAEAMATGADRTDPKDVRKHVDYQPIDEAPDPRRLTVDGEAAPLGAVAGLLLDEIRKGRQKGAKKGPVKTWQQEVAQSGRPPLAVLLQGVAPAAAQPSDSLRRSIQNVLAERNSDLIPRLTPLVSAYHDTGDKLLLVPLDTATGDLETGGYYTTKGVPYELLAGLTGTFELSTGKLRADRASVLTGVIGRHQYVIVPVEPGHRHVRLADDRLELSGGPLTGAFKVKAQRVDGREQLLAQ